MFRGKDVEEISELKREGLSIRAICRLTGYGRKTIRKYLLAPTGRPVYRPRPAAVEQTRALQAVSEGTAAGRCVECAGAAARASGT